MKKMNNNEPLIINEKYIEYGKIAYRIEDISSLSFKKINPTSDDIKSALFLIALTGFLYIILDFWYAFVVTVIVSLRAIFNILDFQKKKIAYNLILIFKTNTELVIGYTDKKKLDEDFASIYTNTEKIKKK